MFDKTTMDETHASVLMYSPDSIGLGHMRRNSAIAAELSKTCAGVSNLLLVGSSAGAFFDLPEGTDCIKLPSIQKTGKNEWAPKSLNVPREVARSLRSRLIEETATTFQPDVFLVDHVPSGIWDELVPALKSLRANPNGPRMILGLRDILGAPADIRERWGADGIYDLIDEHYDSILIYGSPDIFPASELYGLRQRFADRITYCGYIHFGDKQQSKDDARTAIGASGLPMVVMTAGGGHDAYPMMRFVLDALAQSRAPSHFELVVVTGPLMPIAERADIESRCTQAGAQFLVSTQRLATYLAAADALVTMGGYNTVMESIAAGVPAVVVPRIGPSAEQRMRAKLFADLGLLQYVDMEHDTPRDLGAALDAALATPRRAVPALAFDGLTNAARKIATFIPSRTRDVRACVTALDTVAA
jgi:predicted glycosyltransferase